MEGRKEHAALLSVISALPSTTFVLISILQLQSYIRGMKY